MAKKSFDLSNRSYISHEKLAFIRSHEPKSKGYAFELNRIKAQIQNNTLNEVDIRGVKMIKL